VLPEDKEVDARKVGGDERRNKKETKKQRLERMKREGAANGK